MPDVMKPVDGTAWPAGVFLRDSPTWAPSGIIGAPAASASTGDGALSFSVTGSVITVLLSLFRGRSRGAFYERTGSSWSSGAAATADSLATAAYPLSTGSNPRRDRMVLRREIGTQKVYPFIILGTPAATPSAAALVQSESGTYWDTPMFSWTIAGNSSTAISNIVDERVWVDPDGRNPEQVATSAVAIQQTVNPGGTYAWNGPQGRRSPFVGAYMRAEMSFAARFLAGAQQQTIAIQFGVTGGTTVENDHDATERIPGGSGSGEDVRLLKRTAFFICTDAAFSVGYNVVLGTGGSSVIVQNPRCFVTGPYQLI